jgi:hypothetical protein
MQINRLLRLIEGVASVPGICTPKMGLRFSFSSTSKCQRSALMLLVGVKVGQVAASSVADAVVACWAHRFNASHIRLVCRLPAISVDSDSDLTLTTYLRL